MNTVVNFVFGVGAGYLVALNINDVYYKPIRKHVCVPLKEDYEQHGINPSSNFGVFRRGVVKAYREIFTVID
jgi:hypothetical protein